MINWMSYKGYKVSMTFDVEDKVIVGRVQEIDDIISFHGESVAEFEANFHAAIDDILPRLENWALSLNGRQAAKSCFASRLKFMLQRLGRRQEAEPA